MGEMCQQAVAYRTGKNVGLRFERTALRDLIKQVSIQGLPRRWRHEDSVGRV